MPYLEPWHNSNTIFSWTTHLFSIFAGSGINILLLSFIIAAVVRVTQGSSTVAMITPAGIIAPLSETMGYSDPYKALVGLSIASGATILSHVNDSGFWLVGKYTGLSEKQTLQSWTVMETIIALTGLGIVIFLGLFIR